MLKNFVLKSPKNVLKNCVLTVQKIGLKMHLKKFRVKNNPLIWYPIKTMEHCFLNFDATLQPSADQLEQIDVKLAAEMFPDVEGEQSFEKLYAEGTFFNNN